MPHDRVALVTGGTGFIGRRLVALLSKNGWKVVVWSRAKLDVDQFLPAFVSSWPRHNFEDFCDAIALMGTPTIFHLAAAGASSSTERDSQDLWEANAALPVLLMKAAIRAKARGFVLAGTYSEYGRTEPGEPIAENAKLAPNDLYSASKAAVGLWLSALARATESGFSVARIFAAYGPGERSTRLLPWIFRKLQNEQRVPLTSGTQIRDWIFVDDIAAALAHVGNYVRDGNLGDFNICTGEGHSVRDCATRFADLMHKNQALLEFGSLPSRSEETQWAVGNPSNLKKLGWSPRWGFEEGLQSTLEFLRKAEAEQKSGNP